MIRIVSRQPQVCGTVRYRLSNGWFIDGTKVRAHYSQGHRYGIWAPGRHPKGCAGYIGGSETLKGAIAIAEDRQQVERRGAEPKLPD